MEFIMLKRLKYIPLGHLYCYLKQKLKDKGNCLLNKIKKSVSVIRDLTIKSYLLICNKIYLIYNYIRNKVIYFFEIIYLIIYFFIKKILITFLVFTINKIKNLSDNIEILLFSKKKAEFIGNFNNVIIPLLNKYFNEAYVIIYNKEIKTLIINSVISIGFERSDTFSFLLMQFLRNIKIAIGDKNYKNLVWFWGSEELFIQYAAIWLYTRICFDLSNEINQNLKDNT